MSVQKISTQEINKKMPKMSNIDGSIRPSCANIYNVASKENSEKELRPVVIKKASVLGTSSEYNPKYFDNEEDKLDTPNPQDIEVAFLDPGVNTFCIAGSLRVVSECMNFNCCKPNENNVDLPAKVSKFMELFRDKQGFFELSKRYVRQLINGDILFRNKYSKNIKVEIRINEEKKPIIFDNHVNDQEFYGNKEGFEKLVKLFESALTDPHCFFAPHYKIYGTTNEGGEVYPSQELDMSGNGKILFRNPTMGEPHAAGMHAQKIGNALRTIDDWYSNDANVRKLPVDPYGPDKKSFKAKRRPGSGKTFYELLARIDELIERLEKSDEPDADCMFFAAMMVRGGVFSGPKEKKEAKG